MPATASPRLELGTKARIFPCRMSSPAARYRSARFRSFLICSSLQPISSCEGATCLLDQAFIAKVSKANDGVAKPFE
jgi:hypothetical protein